MRQEFSTRGLGSWASWAVFFLTCVASGLLFWQARGTLEGGNRLYHRGKFEVAADIYRARLIDDEDQLTAAYNLGTALLRLEADDAERYLILGAGGPDSIVAHRSHYNLGYRFIRSAEGSTDPVSAGMPLIGAIQSYRAALKLNPTDDDTRWNLAVAQRRFDELIPIAEEGPVEQPVGGDDEVPPDDRDGPATQPEAGAADDADGLPPDDIGDMEGSDTGAREALMGSGDPGTLTEGEAHQLLQGLGDHPERLIRNIFWSQRPGASPSAP